MRIRSADTDAYNLLMATDTASDTGMTGTNELLHINGEDQLDDDVGLKREEALQALIEAHTE